VEDLPSRWREAARRFGGKKRIGHCLRSTGALMDRLPSPRHWKMRTR